MPELPEEVYFTVPSTNRLCYDAVAHLIPEPIYEFCAEFMGTLIFVLLGNSAVAMFILADYTNVPRTLIPVQVIAIGFGLGLTIALYSCGGVTGGHFNPTTSFIFCVSGRCPLVKLLWFFPAQLLGAMAAAGITYGVYNPILSATEKALGVTRGLANSIPFTKPYHHVVPFEPDYIFLGGSANVDWLAAAFGSSVLFSGIFMFVLCAVTDRNQPHMTKLGVATPAVIGLTYGVCTLIMYPIDGGALNPIRDLGGRIITKIAGYGDVSFPGPMDSQWYIFLFAPTCGAILGHLFYDYMIGAATAKSAQIREQQRQERKEEIHDKNAPPPPEQARLEEFMSERRGS